MATNLGKVELKDTYQDAVREMIEAKVAGREGVTVAAEVKPVIDLLAALKDSIAQAKMKPTVKAKPRKRKTRETHKEPAKRKAA